VRGHWGIENCLHWVLDVTFDDDQSRLRKGFGAKNMAIVRHFALNRVRSAKDAKSIKLRRKSAGWAPDYLTRMLNEPVGQYGFEALVAAARNSLGAYLGFHNRKRPHSSLDGRTPDQVYFGGLVVSEAA
jgi:hypothetical protein